MIHVHVIVRLHGTVVEDRVCVVRDAVRLGEGPDAEVCFPGADLLVRRVDDRLLVRGRWLEEGDKLSMFLGAVDVSMEVTVPIALPRAVGWTPDVRVLVATVAIALTGSWWDAVTRFVDAHPAQTRQVAELLVPAPAQPMADAEARNARIDRALPQPDQTFRLVFPPSIVEPGPDPDELSYESLQAWPPAQYRAVSPEEAAPAEEGSDPVVGTPPTGAAPWPPQTDTGAEPVDPEENTR